MANRALWDEMCEVMKWHKKLEHHDCIDTINRLLCKNPHLKDEKKKIEVPKYRLTVSEEKWDLEDLWRLIHTDQITSDEPDSVDPPIIVLRWENTNYLMDGRRRINSWHRDNKTGQYRVLVVHQG